MTLFGNRIAWAIATIRAARRDWRGETWFGYWMGLPWRCRLTGHRMVLQEMFNENVPFTPEEMWYECERCATWGGHAL